MDPALIGQRDAGVEIRIWQWREGEIVVDDAATRPLLSAIGCAT